MKKSKVAILLVAALTVSCMNGMMVPANAADLIVSCSVVYAGGIRLNKSKVQLYAGGKTTITAVGGNSKVTWTSSNSKIASVSSRGKRAVVTARKPGKAVITAKYGKKKLKCTVTVKKAKTVINKSTLKGTWEVDVPMTVKVNKTSIRWIYGSAFYYGNAMKFANNGSFLYYVGAGNGGKGSYKIGSNSITYSVRTYEEGSLEKGTIKVIKGKNIRLMTRYDIYKIYWKKK